MKNSNFYIIRHGEKSGLKTDKELNEQGLARSTALIAYFDRLTNEKGEPIVFHHIYAARDSHNSIRPRQTITPFATHLKKTVHLQTHDQSIQDFVDMLKKHNHENQNIILSWRHEEVLALTKAMGVDATKLPTSADWPTQWPDDVFGWIMRVSFDGNGQVDTTRTQCFSQNLMYTDFATSDSKQALQQKFSKKA